MEQMKELLHWIWLAEALGPQSGSFRALITQYESPYDIYEADTDELSRLPEVTERALAALANKDLTPATAILNACARLGIGVLTYADGRYPNNLRRIKRPPVLLYCKGNLPDFNTRLSIGMVGTRKMSAYGLRHAYKIAYELTSAGAITVSGMAAGIDGVSAGAALAAGGPTVAVLGCGVDLVYPPHHAKLKREIEKSGAVISEYPPGTKPNGYHFPARNRIISGICEGTVVIEAGLGSGSLITAKDAAAEGRDVFALPSNVGSRTSAGTNGLLRDGATLVLSTEDILDPYKYVFPKTLHPEALADVQGKSEADLIYLNDLGVISYTPGAPVKEPGTPAAAPAKEPKKQVQAKEKTETPAASVDPSTLPGLSEEERRVLCAIPDGEAVSLDHLTTLGLSFGEVIAAVTTLEIMGYLQKLPGSQYKKTI
ncbi:MAG: DNA-processing protein DprA [Clostridia bacterium]|nr:DNA-processing protein DprA [Clostridia bacterium]